MSLNIDQLASAHGCSADDYKSMLTPFMEESNDMLEVIDLSLDNDCGAVAMGADSIALSAGHLNLTSIVSAAETLSQAAAEKNRTTCTTAATALKNELASAQSLL